MPVWTNIPGGVGMFRDRWEVFPRWGMPLLLIASIPGIAIALLSIVLLVASLLALLLLTLPVYKLIRWVSGSTGGGSAVDDPSQPPSPGSKQVSVRVLDP